MLKKKELIYAFIQTLPILLSYLFLSMAFGMFMNQAGYSFVWAYLISLTIYTGAFQFALVGFLSNGVGLSTIVLMAFIMNGRHIFYGVSFIETFKKMKKRYPYMVLTLTDETYALYCSMSFPDNLDKEEIMFDIALLSRCYWLIGTLIGSILGNFIPYDLTGIDFCMTALFVTIMIDQWRSVDSHIPAMIGLGSSFLFLVLLGPDQFILPSLLLTCAVLLLLKKKEYS